MTSPILSLDILHAISLESQELFTDVTGSVQRPASSKSFQETTGSQSQCGVCAGAVHQPGVPCSRVSAPAGRCAIPFWVCSWQDGQVPKSSSVHPLQNGRSPSSTSAKMLLSVHLGMHLPEVISGHVHSSKHSFLATVNGHQYKYSDNDSR